MVTVTITLKNKTARPVAFIKGVSHQTNEVIPVAGELFKSRAVS